MRTDRMQQVASRQGWCAEAVPVPGPLHRLPLQPHVQQPPHQAEVLAATGWCKLKGEAAKTRPPETLNCSKSKTCNATKLKPYQLVYLIS